MGPITNIIPKILQSGHTLIYSGRENGNHEEGVGLLCNVVISEPDAHEISLLLNKDMLKHKKNLWNTQSCI